MQIRRYTVLSAWGKTGSRSAMKKTELGFSIQVLRQDGIIFRLNFPEGWSYQERW